MTLIETAYVPSKKLFVVDPASIEVKDHNGVYHTLSARGYGTQTKRGVRAVSRVTFTVWINKGEPCPTPTLENFMRYYGTTVSRGSSFTDAKWDGSYLWTSEPTPLDKMVKISEELDPILQAIPHVPAGLMGFIEETKGR